MCLKIGKFVREAVFALIFVLFLLFLVATLLYFIPKSRTPIDITLNGDKIGVLSNPESSDAVSETIEFHVKDIGPIEIKGHYVEHFFREPQLDISISSIDGFVNFKPAKFNSRAVGTVSDLGNRLVSFYIAERDGRFYTISISFTKDYNDWLFSVQGWDAFNDENNTHIYYGASTNTDTTAEYYEEVFAPLDFSRAYIDNGVLIAPVL